MPGLDGLRALAVAGVIGYHLDVSWLPGGLLGVGIFFTLSGYLITDLLLSSWEATGSLGLRHFWARRARRLLPALFVMLAVVSTWAALSQPGQLGALRGQVLAAALYVSNWWSVFQHVSYFARFGPPSPLGHLWSLAIEEQFYLVWPWLLWLGLVWVIARRRRERSAGRARPAPRAAEVTPRARRAGDQPGGRQVPQLAAREGLRRPDAPALDAWEPERELALAGYGRRDETWEAYGGGAGFRLLGPPPALRRAGVEGEERSLSNEVSGPDEAQLQGPDLLALGYLLSGRSATLSRRPTASSRPNAPARRLPANWGAATASAPRAPTEEVGWPEPEASREPAAERLARYFGLPGTRRALWPLAVAATVLAAASALEMAALYHPSFDPSRVYDGTDTRAFALLLGAALAMLWPSKGMRHHLEAGARRVLDAVGVAGLVVAVVLMCTVGEYSAWLYHGGMLLLSLATVAVVAAAAHPASRFGRVLGVRPLRWLGVRSYGVYLWHYPVIVLTAPSASTGFDLPRAVLQVAATIVLAELSWRFVESPVRRGALGRLWQELRWYPRRWLGWARLRRQRWLALGGVPACIVVAAVALAGGLAGSPGQVVAGGPGPGTLAPSGSVPTTAPVTTSPVTTSPATTSPVPVTSARGTRESSDLREKAKSPVTKPSVPVTAKHHTGGSFPKAPAKPVGPAQLRTSCKQVVHMGDSTSDSLISPNYLPDPAQRLGAEYTRVGVQDAIMKIEGGTSIVETLPGEPNMYQVAQALVHEGYHGCWVFALGTNDAADVYVGSNVGMAERVREMMSLVGKDPVLWVNVKTLVATGPYAEANMEKWDRVLMEACPRYPNMAVFNWAGVVQRSWFIADGIHYSSEGSAKRAAAIADALATAFPAGGPSGRRAGACLVNASPKWDLPNFKY
jgi:peptidoglycan/LPS O-acetylase OafA/YrhL/lysophospholipase L1-like esterase